MFPIFPLGDVLKGFGLSSMIHMYYTRLVFLCNISPILKNPLTQTMLIATPKAFGGGSLDDWEKWGTRREISEREKIRYAQKMGRVSIKEKMWCFKKCKFQRDVQGGEKKERFFSRSWFKDEQTLLVY